MAEVIQFPCPACGTRLRLPLQMAARQGPCPSCGREIVAPDPYRGIAAYEPAPRQTAAVPATFKPFNESPPIKPVVAIESEPRLESSSSQPPSEKAPVPAAASATPNGGMNPPQRAILVLSILLTAVVSLVAGYIVGARSNWLAARIPPPTNLPRSTPVEKPPEQVPDPPTKTVIVRPLSGDGKGSVEPPKPVESVKASAAAKATLEAFLDAPDWSARSAYVLNPLRIRSEMESYSHRVDDGPTAYQSIKLGDCVIDRATGSTHFIFLVETEKFPKGMPVVVSESSDGWQIDWEAFVEFRDDQFQEFVDGPAGQIREFHLVVVQPPPPRAANTENEYFASFLVQSPIGDKQQLSYVKKSAGFLKPLSEATADHGTAFPVLQMAKRNTPEGKSYLEITNLVSDNWLPQQAN